MNEQHNPEVNNNQEQQSDLQRIGRWLEGEVTVSRKILVAGTIILFLLSGIALD